MENLLLVIKVTLFLKSSVIMSSRKKDLGTWRMEQDYFFPILLFIRNVKICEAKVTLKKIKVRIIK